MRCSSIVGGGRHIASMAGPVGVDELAWLGEKLVGVCTKVVTLSLNEVGRDTSRPGCVWRGEKTIILLVASSSLINNM